MKKVLITIIIIVVLLAGCNNNSVTAPKRYLLEMGYNYKTDDSKELQRIKGYTIDAIYLDGKDTIKVKGLSQAQYDSLNIAE